MNCAALPPTLIESELFGREKGAYTGALTKQMGRFELAHGSTIFLDEVGELPLELQAKLLRVLQEGSFERVGSPKTIKVDVRVIAASNRDLAQAARAGQFREDLFYRLNVFPHPPAPVARAAGGHPGLGLRRSSRSSAKTLGKTIESVPRSVIESLQRYPWPGQRAGVAERGGTGRDRVPGSQLAGRTAGLLGRTRPPDRTLEEVEREHILAVLEQTGWRIRGRGCAAEILGLKPTTLEARMAKLGLQRRARCGLRLEGGRKDMTYTARGWRWFVAELARVRGIAEHARILANSATPPLVPSSSACGIAARFCGTVF